MLPDDASFTAPTPSAGGGRDGVGGSGDQTLVTRGRGYPKYEVGPDPWNPQPPICERSFVSRTGSGVYQQILDDEMRFLCALTPGANDPNWSIAYEQSSRLPAFTTSIPEGSQNDVDKAYDSLRTQMCAQMEWVRRRNVPFSDLCGGTLFSSGYDFSSPTISSADITPYCGVEMGLMCSAMIGDRYTTTDTTEMEEDCTMAAWNAACLSYGQNERFYNPNKNDISYNQEALGLMPFWCACACFHSCLSSPGL